MGNSAFSKRQAANKLRLFFLSSEFTQMIKHAREQYGEDREFKRNLEISAFFENEVCMWVLPDKTIQGCLYEWTMAGIKQEDPIPDLCDQLSNCAPVNVPSWIETFMPVLVQHKHNHLLAGTVFEVITVGLP